MESAAHAALKKVALAYLVSRGCVAAATEVAAPVPRWRVDAAGYAEHEFAGGDPQDHAPAHATIIIECKQARGDFLSDARRLDRLLHLRDRLDAARRRAEEGRLKPANPHLRRSGSFLFADLESWDLHEARDPAYERLLSRLERVEKSIYGDTKFGRLVRYSQADYLYILAPVGVLRPRETPPGWGLIEADPRALSAVASGDLGAARAPVRLSVPASPRPALPGTRSRLLRNIAVAATRTVLEQQGLDRSLQGLLPLGRPGESAAPGPARVSLAPLDRRAGA